MKPLSHYEPTKTDELLRKNATSKNTLSEDYSALAAHAVRLEQKLAACREALEHTQSCNKYLSTDVEIMQDRSRKTLAATAP